MEAPTKVLADLMAAISSMNAKLNDLYPVVLELNKDSAVDVLPAEVGDLRARVIDATRPAKPAADKDLPPLLLSADTPSSSSKPTSASKQTSAIVAEVPALTCSKAEQDIPFQIAGATTVALLHEDVPEFSVEPAAPHCSPSANNTGKETLYVVLSACTGSITTAPTTCSMEGWSRDATELRSASTTATTPTLTMTSIDVDLVSIALTPLEVIAIQVLQPFTIIEHEVDANWLDINGVPASAASIYQVHAALIIDDTDNKIQVGSVMPFDPGRKLQSSVQALLATSLASSEVCVFSGCLDNHKMLNVDTICNTIPIMDDQWFCKISSCEFLIKFRPYNTLLIDALWSILACEVEVTWLYKGRGISDAFGINFTMSWDPSEQPMNYEMLGLFSCLDSQRKHSKWTGQQLAYKDIMVDSLSSSVHGGESTDDSPPYKHIHIFIPCIASVPISWSCCQEFSHYLSTCQSEESLLLNSMMPYNSYVQPTRPILGPSYSRGCFDNEGQMEVTAPYLTSSSTTIILTNLPVQTKEPKGILLYVSQLDASQLLGMFPPFVHSWNYMLQAWPSGRSDIVRELNTIVGENLYFLLLPWVLEQEELSLGFQFQQSSILPDSYLGNQSIMASLCLNYSLKYNLLADTWSSILVCVSVGAALHIFVLPVKKHSRDLQSVQSAIGRDALLFLIGARFLVQLEVICASGPSVTPCPVSGTIYRTASSKIVLGKEDYAPWDPGGHVPVAVEDGGLRASRMLRGEECHEPCGTVYWVAWATARR